MPRELDESHIHQIIAIQVGVEDEIRDVADVRLQVANLREQLPVQFINISRFQLEELLSEETRVLDERIVLSRRVEYLAKLLVDCV